MQDFTVSQQRFVLTVLTKCQPVTWQRPPVHLMQKMTMKNGHRMSDKWQSRLTSVGVV